MKKGTRKICSRGHVFYKSSDCPVCPMCWSGYYRKKAQSDFPSGLSAPAMRALQHAKIKNLSVLGKHTKSEILGLHGMGPSGVALLEKALRAKKLAFKK
jgi:hypothetical protein